MATKTENLELDTGFAGGGEQLRQSLAENFEKIDARALPAVTAADNGKVLMVVDGAWAVAEIPAA
jgi:CobQ-like glutamine amidotransferase family enzyme